MGVNIRAAERVFDGKGEQLGSLFLYASSPRKSYGSDWAIFCGLTRPLTFELRLVESGTGTAIDPIRREICSEDTQTPPTIHPEPVHAEVVIFDEHGDQIAVAQAGLC